MMGSFTLLVLAAFIFELSVVVCFNLENREPIIKRGENGSYFGYSVAQHKIYNDSLIRSDVNNWLLVGAPLGKNLQPGTNRSGALYKCKMSYYVDECKQVPTDGRRYEDSNDLHPPGPDEIKENQWMGVVVRSQGPEGMVMVCAHRYILAVRESRFGQGLCYTLTNELNYENAYEPCKGRPTTHEHEQFAFCQAGTSAVMLEDGTALFGAPGPLTWRGAVFAHTVSGDFLSRDKTMYLSPTETLEKYSYLGMSVAGGNFFGGETVYASGAPRSNGTGQVFIFSKKKTSQEQKNMDLMYRIRGEQFASSFGYELTALDINGDRVSDLIVGAPFYFSRDEEGGAVYIYTNLRHCLAQQICEPSMKLTGKPESRFGFAISTLGDINKDGFNDIAIGAPYEGRGAVYIYLGSKTGLIKEPSQILYPDKRERITTLGYSLSGGLDMDDNGYPDLLVGAYESDSAVLYLGRVIIDIETEITGSGLKNIDPNKQKCVVDSRSNTTCFTFKACCTLKPQIGSTNDKNSLIYQIEAETFSGEKKFSRVYFKNENDGGHHHIIKRNIPIIANRNKYCQEETVYLKENTKDILSAIKFRLNYTLGNDKAHSAILNKQESEKIFMATFQKDCGSNDICESNLVLDAKLLLKEEKGSYILKLGEEDEVKLDISVTNYGEPAYETQLYVNHPYSLSYIATGKSSNIICNYRNETIVVCNLGNPFKQDNRAYALLRFEPKHLSKSESRLKFHIHVNSTSKELSDRTTAALTATVVKQAEVGITGSATSNVLYGGDIKGESAMKYLDDIGSRVMHKYQVTNNGPWKIEYLEVHIEWPYQVANNKPQGKWLLYLEEKPIIDGGEICKISPDSVNPLNLLIKPGTQDLATDNEVITSNPDPSYNATTTLRRKRDTEMVIVPETFIDSDGHKRQVVNMNCQNSTAKCLKFYCTIRNLEKNNEATVKIRGRLWNSTLVEDYPKIDWVRIVSSARIYIPPEYSIEQNTANDDAIAETLAYPDLLEQEAEPAPLWIIIVAVVAGLLLLILLTLLLWKLGFFKRQRLDPTLSGNLEKHSKEETPFLRDS